MLTGCDGFFPPVVPVPPGSTGNYVYVANATGTTASGSNAATGTVTGFAVGTATLTAVPSSPLVLGYIPVAMAVTRNNKFLYVATQGNINAYTINSDGSLSASSSGTGVAIVNVVSMDVSPDGQWLVALDGNTLQAQVDVFQINTTTGALAAVSNGTLAIPNAVINPRMVKISPNGAYIFAALGTEGMRSLRSIPRPGLQSVFRSWRCRARRATTVSLSIMLRRISTSRAAEPGAACVPSPLAAGDR
jgi:Uncharacterized conserved protein